MILVKIHNSGTSEVICLCDSGLLGKKFSQDNMYLNITERFYRGVEMPEDKMLSLMKTSRNLNIVGRESITFALKHHFITKESVIIIQGIPHAQVL